MAVLREADLSQSRLYLEPRSASGYTPPELPSLSGVNRVQLDTETTGLRWWDEHQMIGLAVRTPDGRSWYLPIRHKNGGNIPEEKFFAWARQELQGKLCEFLNAQFDLHMMYRDGIDLEAQGCRVTDVGHQAALLDDWRRTFNLEDLSQDYLGEGKVQGLSAKQMAEYHPSEVDPYARQDVRLVGLLSDKFRPMIIEQELERVAALEDKVIFPVCEMERNCAPIDTGLLDRWCNETEQDLLACLSEVQATTDLWISPGSTTDIQMVFDRLGLEPNAWTETGAPSFDDAALREYDHPVVKSIRRARRISSLRSKFLTKYQEETKSNRLLRYALHQLRTGEGGTVSGRFSSSGYRGAGGDRLGVNIQQVMRVGAQKDTFGDNWIVRQLFVPERGLWLSGDARQIEYRLFAHYANSEKLNEAYRKDPLTNFHELVQKLISEVLATVTYKNAKDVNFAKLFGAGLKKIAAMLGLSLAEAKAFVDVYDSMFPEVPQLQKRAIKAAEERGFVKTFLGRRARFPQGQWSHKALNRVIQGGAADINKQKLVELHEARFETGFVLRFTVHDEVDGDVPDEAAADKVRAILDRQSFDLRVPILWEVKTGANWRECK